MTELTQKQRRFCEEYVIDSNGKQAAIRAGYSMKAATQQGSTLLTYPKVVAEIDRLRAEQRARLNVTIEMITKQLIADRELAHNEGQAGAAVSASMALAKLHGLMVDKREVRVVSNMTPEQIEEELAEVQRELEDIKGETRH